VRWYLRFKLSLRDLVEMIALRKKALAAVAPTFESARNCKIQEETDGLLINVETQQPFAYKDACVVRGPHLGYNPTSTQAAKTAVKAFLKTLFKLD
jgi:hypothetical protein